jgi:hypothetical protein
LNNVDCAQTLDTGKSAAVTDRGIDALGWP